MAELPLIADYQVSDEHGDLSALSEAQRSAGIGDTVTWTHEGTGTRTGTVIYEDPSLLQIDPIDEGSGGPWWVHRSLLIEP